MVRWKDFCYSSFGKFHGNTAAILLSRYLRFFPFRFLPPPPLPTFLPPPPTVLSKPFNKHDVFRLINCFALFRFPSGISRIPETKYNLYLFYALQKTETVSSLNENKLLLFLFFFRDKSQKKIAYSILISTMRGYYREMPIPQSL